MTIYWAVWLRAALKRLWHRLLRFGHDGPWQEPKWKLK